MIEIEARSISASRRERVRRVDRIGQPDVGDAGVDEHLGLADLRAADADRAALDLPSRDDRRFVGLGVRTQPKARAIGERLDAAMFARSLA